LNFDEIEVDDKGLYVEEPMQVVDRREQVMQPLWQHHGMEEATWESEEAMKCKYPYLFHKLRTF